MQRFHKLYLMSTLRDLYHPQQIGLPFEGRPDSEVHGGARRLPWTSRCTKIGLLHIARVHLDIFEHSC
jgi:hypothetical protein